MKPISLLSILFIAACAPATDTVTRAATTDIAAQPMRSFTSAPQTRATRANVEMAQDFIDLTFEMENGTQVPVLTRFDGPISVRVEGPAPASLAPDLRALVSRLKSEAGIDIFQTSAPDANITIEIVPRAALMRAVPNAACFVVPRVSNWAEYTATRRGSRTDWTTLTRRERASVFIPTGITPQELRDCLHEEVAQALGPLNDLYRLPDSVFNDDNIHSVLTGFDMLMLRTYYAPELQNGMRRGEVTARLPAILARLNPRGQGVGSSPQSRTPDVWRNHMAVALDSDIARSTRQNAAEQAVAISIEQGWTGTRSGFAHYAQGRSTLQSDPARALSAFQQARTAYARSATTDIHAAHVAVQLAAFSLSAGDAATTLDITTPAIQVAQAHQNAALLSTLLMFRSEALLLSGASSQARDTRLDSLAWARYGFGTEQAAQERLSDIGDLRPNTGS